jgi:hypothetical protein
MMTLRAEWFALLPDPGQAAIVPDFQPFFLHALGQSLKIMGDPDWEIFCGSGDSFSNGVPVGVGITMPRTPEVFRRKERWRKYDDSDFVCEMDNYTSAKDAGGALRKQFLEEADLGMMFEIPLSEAREKYPGDSLRIAAQGAIEKSDDTFRILHDGTHGVRINNEIRVLDQLDFSGPGDAAATMQSSLEEANGVQFAIAGDIKKAHRRVLHRKADWGLMACRDSSEGDSVWINRVGTFGLGSIAYWWARLAGGAGRFTGRLALDSWVWVLLFADDLHMSAGGRDKWKVLLRLLTAWIMIGTPFSWKKFRGGLALDWVGYWLDYERFEIGISEQRARWLATWLRSLTRDKATLVRRFSEGLGRLGFSAQVVLWLKPCLSPLYSWAASAPAAAVLTPPELVLLTADFIANELTCNLRQVPCTSPVRLSGEWFRTDAKCADDLVVLGGWECKNGVEPKQARWFCIPLTPAEAPFLFKEKQGVWTSSWASTSAELLASLVAVLLFVEDLKQGLNVWQEVVVTGATDNQANDAISKKRSSTKLPLMLIVMQLARSSSRKGIRLNLDWIPRLENQTADDLTNMKFDAFLGRNRIQAVWQELELQELRRLLLLQESFQACLLAQKKNKAELIQPRLLKKAKLSLKTVWE